ncbi:MAG: hydrogenase expression/formation protein HypE [Thermodesulfobacteriota bacterium]
MKTVNQRILLDHGAGGRAAHELVTGLFLRHLAGQEPARLEDAALIAPGPGRLAFSTDSFVVTPLFFPGGDIGELAVYGTVNDIAMRGARPLFLSAGFILEEGLEMDVLDRIVASMARAAAKAGVAIVAGDTKVVPKGAADRVFINTSGLGVAPDGVDISAARARPGDAVILSGTMGDHGLAVLCRREGLSLETEIVSDAAPLAGLVQALLEAAPAGSIHALRDPTRGGVGTTLNEIALSSGVGMTLDEESLPVTEAVRGACDILGLDPLYVANEGKVLAVAAPEAAAPILAAMKAHEYGRKAAVVGRVTSDHAGQVFLQTIVGGLRIVDMLTGEQLPRIC